MSCLASCCTRPASAQIASASSIRSWLHWHSTVIAFVCSCGRTRSRAWPITRRIRPSPTRRRVPIQAVSDQQHGVATTPSAGQVGVESMPMAETDVRIASQVRGIGAVCAVLPAFAWDGTIMHRIDNPHGPLLDRIIEPHATQLDDHFFYEKTTPEMSRVHARERIHEGATVTCRLAK